ncbi:MAG: hypothetical protein ACRDLQ_06680 [Solirubrobacterales bacterium]
MVAFRALHAQRRTRLRGRRPTRAEPGATAPDPVAVTRATVIAAEAFADARVASEWLRRCGSGRDAAAAEVEEALALVNLAVSAHRVAAQDPHVRDLVAADVQRVRLGYGTGDEVVDGAWREAYVIPPERAQRRTRRPMLSPQEEMAGMLSGRRPGARPSEELLLRARLDLDHGRLIEAALITRAAVEALAAEGHGGGDSQAATRLADAALADELSPDRVEELAELVAALERAVRRRRYADES